MTRETKIGLLVGLAFIIVIGILLSDHLTSTTEPVSAPLARVASNARDGITTLGRPTVPAVTIEPPPVVEPVRPVVTPGEMKSPTGVADIIKLGPTPAPVQPEQPGRVSIVDGSVQPQQPVFIPQPGPDAGALNGLVNQHGSDLVVIDGGTAVQPVAPQPVVSQFREYKAQEGDTLNKLAGRFLGKNTAANRDAIVRANPSLKDDPNRIIVGRTYLIPTAGVAVVNLPLPNAPLAPVAPVQQVRPVSTGTYWYTVKENDSLWKIAARELGDGNAYTVIKELNKDILKGTETVRENMRLRIPAKTGGAQASIAE